MFNRSRREEWIARGLALVALIALLVWALTAAGCVQHAVLPPQHAGLTKMTRADLEHFALQLEVEIWHLKNEKFLLEQENRMLNQENREHRKRDWL
jgi:CHASE1-domain containing sensor protein